MTADTYLIRRPMRLIEAEAWVIARLGATPRAEHSRFVGGLMAGLALRLSPPEVELWEITGLLHDIDYFVVGGDWAIHGRTAAAWLEGRLPIQSLVAIAAHDHRSGVVSETAISQALRLCDALAVFDAFAGRAAATSALRRGNQSITEQAGTRPHLAGMVSGLAARLGLTLEMLAELLMVSPVQGRDGAL